MLRISPGISGHTHEYISTGQLDSKFGFPIHEDVALNAVKELGEYPNLEFRDIHCHIGSQLFNKDVYHDTVSVMVSLMFQIKQRFSIEIEELNMGGGFGIFYSVDILIRDIKISEVEPAVVMIRDGKPRIVVKRETYEDLVRNDLE
ncbi:MAG: hypothetical protein ACM3TR_17045 [Caulobacteraceae bacterium]